MADAAPGYAVSATQHARVLLVARARQLRNVIDQRLRDAPYQTLIVLLVLVGIWAGLYLLLERVLWHVRAWELIGVVAQGQMFINFFFILGVMLAFSNAILAFGSLFGRDEAAHLLAMPADARHVILVKWIEGLVLSSWSFLLLGVPLMLAIAAQPPGQSRAVAWYFYPLFAGHFLSFVIIPATLGVIVAWAVALWAPRRPLTLAVMLGGAPLLFVVVWFWRLSRQTTEAEVWLSRLMEDLAFTRATFLPSSWTARGILATIEQRVDESVFYLVVVLGNALFLVWVMVNIVGPSWAEAFNRAQQGRTRGAFRIGWLTGTLATVLFWYLPPRVRALLTKDLRSFARDATQWTQMAIMFGLLLVFAFNLQQLPIESGMWRALFAGLNLIVVCLILATFTSRFVYPMLSLETQQFWLLALLPLRKVTILLAKFVFALTCTALAGMSVMGVALYLLKLPPAWTRVHAALCLGVCVGLSGLSVGIGARYPVLGQRNPARIASGLGGVLNLVASVLFVFTVMTGAAWLTIKGLHDGELDPVLPRASQYMFILVLAFCGVTAAGALTIGARHFAKLEC